MVKAFGAGFAAIQIGALAVAVAIPLIFASALVFDRLVQEERQRVRESLMLRAKSLAALVDNELENYAALGWALAQSPALADGELSHSARKPGRSQNSPPASGSP